MFERRLYHHIDWALVGAVLLLCGLGLAMIYSTTYDLARQATGPQFRIQIYAVILGLAALAICLLVDYRALAEHSLVIYGALIVLLLYVMFFGEVRGGSRRWISLGVFNLQPSEFGRIAVALVLATFFGENRRGVRTSNELAVAAALTFVPLVLVARQPDLGTAVTLLPVYLGIAFVAGMRLRFLAVLGLIALLAAPVAWTYALEDYQRSRLSTFLDPGEDPRGAGYQQIQARITVGSGGLTGKGFMQGTQGQYKFLPVAHNDFIFSVLAEEAGFLGVLAALGLYLFVILRSLEAARLAKDRLGSYLVTGLVSGFAFQVIYNVTMSAGLAPVKGLTLPLMSYGGSSMIATLAGFGLILNVRMRRFTN
jgi:rod shape determining protein RodA